MKSVKKYIALFVVVCALGYGTNALAADEFDVQLLNSIDNEYQELLEKEQAKLEEFKSEKSQLEQHLELLKSKREGKAEMLAELEKHSQIRWHRDEYKKLLIKYEDFHKKLDKAIEETETKISELEKIIYIMSY